MEDALYEIESVRRFAGYAGVTAGLPDEPTILNFRHLLEQHQLTASLLTTIIAAPGSTKNQTGKRDEAMHQTRKGNHWYFGMNVHVGADVNSGAVHTMTVTPANVADIDELPKLGRPEDAVIFADAGYASDEYKRGSRHLGLHWKVQDKRKPKQELSSKQRRRNRQQSSIRAWVEHVFRVIKRQFCYLKVRYRGLAKNASQVNMLVGLSNRYLLRGRLLASG